MSDQDKDRKTEWPTAKHLRDLRAKGEVARAHELARTATFASACIVMAISWPDMFERLEAMLVLPASLYELPFDDALSQILAASARDMVALCLPILATVSAVAVGASMFPSGWVFSVEVLVPRFDRVNPAAGFERLMSGHRWASLIRAAAVSCAVVVGLWVLFVQYIGDLVHLPNCDAACLEPASRTLTSRFVSYSLCIIGLVTVFDTIYQVYRHRLDHRMTKEEVRRERRNDEGDPVVRRERKRLHREAVLKARRPLDRSMVAFAGPGSAVILRYVRGVTPLPEIIAAERGHGAIKLMIRVRGIGLRMAQRPELVEALLTDGKVGNPIPSEHIKATATAMYKLLYAKQ